MTNPVASLAALLRECPFISANAAPTRTAEWYANAEEWLLARGVTIDYDHRNAPLAPDFIPSHLSKEARGRPEGPSAPPPKISEPTNDELVSLGECAVDGYLDFVAAKSWFSNWLAERPQ